MPSKVLITGAAGYIGGSLVTDFLAGNNGLFERAHISAAVRSGEQAKALSRLGINVLQLDLTDENTVVESILRHEISIVVHCASALDPRPALHLITALSKQKEISGQETYYIHTSGLAAFLPDTGWPPGETKDTGPVFDVEKQLADSFPARKTDVAVVENAKAQGVTSFIVVPPIVYGKGSGEWNKLSVVLPILVKASISSKTVHKFAENTKVSAVHISDLTALYGRIVEKILRKEVIPSGTEGYYFALAHDLQWWETLNQLATALDARGLITDPEVHLWPSNEAAAELLGVPVPFVQLFWNSGENIVAENAHRLGWELAWKKDRFLQNIDDEIEAVLELDKPKSSLVNSLFQVTKG